MGGLPAGCFLVAQRAAWADQVPCPRLNGSSPPHSGQLPPRVVGETDLLPARRAQASFMRARTQADPGRGSPSGSY